MVLRHSRASDNGSRRGGEDGREWKDWVVQAGLLTTNVDTAVPNADVQTRGRTKQAILLYILSLRPKYIIGPVHWYGRQEVGRDVTNYS